MDKLSIDPKCIVRMLMFIFAAMLYSNLAVSQDENTLVLSESPTTLDDPIQFLEYAPTIDGVLDENLSGLIPHAYSRIEGSSQSIEAFPDAHYRLAYGTDFLYVYIEADADSLIYRDRAYQMGDGFHMVIANPLPDNEPTEEFYVLACSAVRESRLEWSRRIFWYHNVHDIFQRTSEDARLEFADGDGIISFELYLPWKDVHPYHPWISDGIGFNLRLVKAVGADDLIRYDVVYDECIDCELHPRDYAVVSFEPPEITGESQTFAMTYHGHINEGGEVGVKAATVSGEPSEETITVVARSGEGTVVEFARETYALEMGITRHSFLMTPHDILPGGYEVTWESTRGHSGNGKLTVLPELNLDTYRAHFSELANTLPQSHVNTLQFKLEEVALQIDSAYDYETCGRERMRLTRVTRDIDKALTGNDPYAGVTGFIRKAYRSEVDSTLQPYMVWIPEDYNPGETYPLLVYLHGSASTEVTLTNRGAANIIPDGFIAVAPRGRGTSNCFTADHAQEDIADVISTIIQNYPIDTTKIILAGFSMGGYGVYRTQYETPNRFCGLAIFSGHPNLANSWYPDSGFPNFTDSDLLKNFAGMPVFIFHGEQDRNAVFDVTATEVELLKAAGAEVEYYFEADKGHEEASQETLDAYLDWAKRVSGQDDN